MSDNKKGRGNDRHFGPGGFGKPGEKPKNFKKTLKRLINYIVPHKFKIMIVFLFSVLSTVFSIWSPKILGKATTKLFEGLMAKMRVPNSEIDFTYILGIIAFLVGLYLISALFTYIQQYIMASISQKIVYNMRKDIDVKLTRLPLNFFDSKTHGEILSRITNDVDTISTALQQSLTQIISSVVTIIGIIIMMLTISPFLTLISIIVLPISLIFAGVIAKKSQNFFAGQQKTLGELNGHVEEMYTAHNIVKAFGRENQSIEKFNETNSKLYDFGWKAQYISGIIMPILNFVGNLGYVAICVVGGMFVAKRSLEIGDIQAFIQYSKQFTWPIMQTANIANVIQSTVAGAERVFELLDEKEEYIFENEKKEIEITKGNISIENVKFGYVKDIPIIKNLNIEIKQGETIAIVGPTGAGKTTLVNLLMRFYEINDGKIKIDGIDARDIKRGSLRSLFGMVLQDTWLFNGTIRDNIAYGRINATEEEVINSAIAAHADHFIRTLPEGYNTILNEEASNISQGQKQLLTIARAILADPSILILDEATSSVDTRTEVLIQRAMHKLMQGRTSFVIAHRLSTIRDADCILVMKDGDIIEKGKHEDLLAQKGFYSELYNSQFVGKTA